MGRFLSKHTLFFNGGLLASKNIIIAAFYSETFALWSLCKYSEDEDKYLNVTEKAREITRMKYLGFLTGWVIEIFVVLLISKTCIFSLLKMVGVGAWFMRKNEKICQHFPHCQNGSSQ